MLKFDIKDENFKSRCRACLSVGRKLQPVVEYEEIYRILVRNGYKEVCEECVKLCWECNNLLQKAAQFQERFRKASEMIQLGQTHMYGSLSCLTTVVMNDSQNIIYVHEPSLEIYIKTEDENNKEIIINNESDNSRHNYDNTQEILHSDVSTTDQNAKRDEDQTVGTVMNNCKRKTRINNKWAEKRVMQNKKPKFKILDSKQLNFDNVFKRLQLRIDELKECMQSERDRYEFRVSKNKCDSCVVVFKNEGMLKKHYRKCHAPVKGNFICDICKSRFKSKKCLKVHIKKHFTRLKCNICHSFINDAGKSRHLSEHKKVFQCMKCGLMYGCRREFFKHFKEWHEKFVCHHCGITFKMRYCIKDHLRKCHTKFECKSCDKTFARYNGLWLHNKVRHTASQPAYCVECDTHYPDVYRYRWHLANSAKHNPRKKLRIPCPGCDKVFSKNIYMKEHYNLVHLKQYNYRCDDCDKNFIRNADLVKHTRRIHEGILPPKNKRCHVCGKGFTTNKILTQHMRTHAMADGRIDNK